ncbi:ATP-binding protein [Asticcacaulis sp. EMRT-3]|uniref:sensor histidine kinase n=1 Tax=Asticcacaulis sp. EMRT-3 TaxID=3040349 RepID=UPI0024AFF178|nr:ATP-binding protein [Asticcacaulis sp. EMRT-3]MDI7775644.1 ATP-binding protein [Asticcacaulis sp. EMRT-3]
MTPDDLSSPTHDEIREYLHRQMLSSVSHDLKTPLATIIGSLEVMTMLYDRLSEEKRKSLISSALTEAFRLDYFITNILDMAKFEADSVKPRFEAARLGQMIQDALARMGPLKTKGEIRITATAARDELTTDPMLGSRAIGLVLHNAFKFGGRREGRVTESPVIEVQYGVANGEGFVRIRDHGDGIPDSQQVAVFDKYMRLQKTDQQNAGTGLGLTICQSIMRLLGGRIEVANHPDGGAIFTLFYPDQKKL